MGYGYNPYTIFATITVDSREEKRKAIEVFDAFTVKYRELGENKLEIRHIADKKVILFLAEFCMRKTAHSVNFWEGGEPYSQNHKEA